MLAYRVFASLGTASAGSPGHPEYIPTTQTTGRWDNADHYRMCYLALSPDAAIGEVFGDIPSWTTGMFDTPYLPGARRALAVFEVSDSLAILDLDDAQTLVEQRVRPTQVVTRNPSFTQNLALDVFRQRTDSGDRRWNGIRWPSFHRPYWFLLGLWMEPGANSPLKLLRVEPLTLDEPAVRNAARSLVRQLPSLP